MSKITLKPAPLAVSVRLHSALRRCVVVAALLLPFGGTASAQQSRVISVQVIPHACSVLQDLLDDLGAEFATVRDVTKPVPQPLLDRLSAAGIEKIEIFFRCFGLTDATVSKRDAAKNVVRVITTEIPLWRVRFTKEPHVQIIEQVLCVALIISQTKDGALLAWGGYTNCR